MLQQLSMAVEQSPASVIITDPEGRISYTNRKFTEVTGYLPEEVLGKTPRILKSGLTPPEAYRTLWSAIKEGREWRGEFCNEKKNGELFWEAATIRPICDASGTITHYLALKEDITERRRAERELRLTQFSVEQASDGVLWADRDARIVYANQAACRNLERSREELLSLSIPDVAPPFSMEDWRAHWQQLKTAGVANLEASQTSKSGRVFPVEVTANYLEFDGQEYSFAFVRDVTERRELEGQLRHAQKLEGVGQLAAGIAHEINTPTQFVTDNLTFLRDSWNSTDKLLRAYRNAIKNSAEALPADLLSQLDSVEKSSDLDFLVSEVPRAIDQSLDGAHRIAEIVRAMKEFSHPDSLEKTATDLNKGVVSTITVARNEWRYVADVATRLDETLPRVVCYPGDINQVVLNLVVNAAHAIKEKMKDSEKGKITVCTRMRGEFAEISVIDTGNGIPEKIRTRIFDPFFTTKEVGKGTGQGLSLAHTVIVKKHGGKIWFETELGRGTTFFINLPIKPPDRGEESQ
jgi:PAS domain S-box-containing protein